MTLASNSLYLDQFTGRELGGVSSNGEGRRVIVLRISAK